jgi:hypothetical protein
MSPRFFLVTLAPLFSLAAAPLPTLDEALSSKKDLYADAAIARPEGPTLDFFWDLIPPLRYVDAPSPCYPIALSAPRGPVKAPRLRRVGRQRPLSHAQVAHRDRHSRHLPRRT